MTNAFISSGSQVLPSKELALFRKILKCYEQKQYKVGLRCAKQILSNPNFCEHGETLAMKGLILNCMGKHEEALEIVKKGLAADLKSHVCWHVFGLVQRSDKRYDEAIKAYKMALRIEKENVQILRDLSLLQIQLRDLEGYRDSRYQLLVLKPSKMSWIGYASAYHLLKEYDVALYILGEFKKNNRAPAKIDIESSEIILYEIMILTEAGRFGEALARLEENSTSILDRLAYFEIRASLLINLERFEDAERVYWTLIDRNPDNIFYYKQIEKCRKLDNTQQNNQDLITLYDTIILQRPKASLPKLIYLLYVDGPIFEEKVRTYLITCFRKGIPSLFKNLLTLYDNQQKVKTIERILLDFVYKFEENGYNRFSLDGSNLPECPTTVLWTYYYLAQHFDRLKNYQRALKYIDEALKHTPTLIELYMAKAKIFKHSGDYTAAADLMLSAQELDTADRYLNSKCAKYLLRDCRIKEAEEMCSKFTREGMSANDSMIEMQCLWYEYEAALAYFRLAKYGESLQKCHQIEQHFVNFYEDQYDFHGYCLRKMTLSTYIKFLRFEDVLNSQQFYVKATKLAVSIYIDMVENPQKFVEKQTQDNSALTPAELRKLKRKANKAKAEKDKQNAEQAAKQSTSKQRMDGEFDVFDPEPFDTQKLLKPENPIEEACKFIKPILQMPCEDVDFWVIAFRVYSYKDKLLIMLKCLYKIFNLDPTNKQLLNELFAKYKEKFEQSEASKIKKTSNLLVDLTKALEIKLGINVEGNVPTLVARDD
uniref:Uncharacterized protein n=1 Tax=Meloidogyne enterolobii TaxID=390850 RepID=A0A6V7VQ72_MELEN|nr:unnamed protein product [Meloidogyne enterolobii]